MHLALSIIASFCLIGVAHSKFVAQLSSDDTGARRVPTISIVGGTPADEGEFPYVTVLRLGHSLCGGSLIGPLHVLTAAHCLSAFSEDDVDRFKVFINTLSVDGGGPNAVVREVTKFIIHERYNVNPYDNDIALLVLNSPVAACNTFVKLPTEQVAITPTTGKPTTKTTRKPSATTKAPACSCTCPTPSKKAALGTVKTTKKPAKAFSTYANVRAIIAGWGTTSSGGSISSTLLKANVTILPNSICAAQYSNFVGDNMLCAAAPGTDTCQGDSGGPILVNGVVVGITSYGTGCADPNYAGVYTRVSTYVDWIKTTQANTPG